MSRRRNFAELLGLTDRDQLRDWLAGFDQRFGVNVRTARNRRRFTSRDRRYSGELIAEAMRDLGFKTWRQTTMTKVEHGERPLKLAEALALCALLDVRLADMVIMEDQSVPDCRG